MAEKHNYRDVVILPPSVETMIESICRDQNQPQLDSDAQRQLAVVGEERSLRILNTIVTTQIALGMKPAKGNDSVFWETSMEFVIKDHRCVDGINIGHGGKTVAIFYRYGMAHNHHRMIEETWRIKEVDFNIYGLSMDCFLPPSDLKKEQHGVM